MSVIREWIAAAAVSHCDAPYLEDASGSATLTYAELSRSARAWARQLDDAGIAPGRGVAVCLPDPVGYATALAGIVAAGRVAVPLDPAAPAADAARVLAVARPAAIVGSSSTGGLDGLALIQPPGDLAESGSAGSPGTPAGAGGIFLCTSGTTGTPKGILLREDQLCHVAGSVASHHRLSSADRGYCSLPLFHVNAEVVGLLATLSAGACLVLDRKFSRRRFWPLITEREVTWINAVPAIISVLAMEPAGVQVPRRVRFVRSASAPLPPSALLRFEDAFGIPVVETYGMTEAASMITANPLDGPRKPGSAGLPAGTELRVLPLPDEAAGMPGPCPPGVVGRVQIRGRGVITRYASGGRPGTIDPTGWLATGDLGYLDSDGYLFLAGRSDDVINRGGEKIYPREIEELLLAQPGVRSAAVVPAHDEVLGERPVAYVVPAAHDAGMATALHEACAAGLPRHKRPATIHVVAELPVGPTGKVARSRLKELAYLGR